MIPAGHHASRTNMVISVLAHLHPTLVDLPLGANFFPELHPRAGASASRRDEVEKPSTSGFEQHSLVFTQNFTPNFDRHRRNFMATPQADPEEGYHELNSGETGYYDLPPYPHSLRRRLGCCSSSPSLSIVLVSVILVLLTASLFTAGFVFWPTPPDVEVKQWKLNGISIDTTQETTESSSIMSLFPSVHLNVSLDMLVQIANPNHAGLVYDQVTVRIVYRGDEVGQVQSGGSRIKARSTANHTATVELEGGEIMENAKELVEDYYNGEMNLTTFTTVDGALQLWFVKPLLKVTVACDLVVNPKNQTILSQECGF